MNNSRCLAIVPVKPLNAALGRLAEVLDARDRYALQSAMLRDVLRACATTSALSGAIVVTADLNAANVAREEGAEIVGDYTPPRGMNAAVRLGVEVARQRGARAALILTADVPLVSSDDLETLARWPEGGGDVVLAPSRDGTGTNAMLLRPPAVIDPGLGPNSLTRHRARAEASGVVAQTIDLPSVALDIDTPGDLAELRESRTPCLARQALGAQPAAAGSSH